MSFALKKGKFAASLGARYKFRCLVYSGNSIGNFGKVTIHSLWNIGLLAQKRFIGLLLTGLITSLFLAYFYWMVLPTKKFNRLPVVLIILVYVFVVVMLWMYLVTFYVCWLAFFSAGVVGPFLALMVATIFSVVFVALAVPILLEATASSGGALQKMMESLTNQEEQDKVAQMQRDLLKVFWRAAYEGSDEVAEEICHDLDTRFTQIKKQASGESKRLAAILIDVYDTYAATSKAWPYLCRMPDFCIKEFGSGAISQGDGCVWWRKEAHKPPPSRVK